MSDNPNLRERLEAISKLGFPVEICYCQSSELRKANQKCLRCLITQACNDARLDEFNRFVDVWASGFEKDTEDYVTDRRALLQPKKEGE